MTPYSAPADARRPDGARPVEPTRGTRSLSRRRTSLLKIARRDGDVRVRVGDGRPSSANAAEVSDLLDELNAGGWLRYGGLHRAEGVCELIYFPV